MKSGGQPPRAPIQASVFVGISIDGFLARSNGDPDFLPEGGGEEHGYAAVRATVDTFVIRRNTYDKVLRFQLARVAPADYNDGNLGCF